MHHQSYNTLCYNTVSIVKNLLLHSRIIAIMYIDALKKWLRIAITKRHAGSQPLPAKYQPHVQMHCAPTLFCKADMQ